MGYTNKQKMVLVIKPPMTTIAKGLDASEPIPVDNAAGIKPIAAIIAVMITGLSLVATPSRMALQPRIWCI